MEKKIVGLAMAVLLLFLLAACNLTNDNEMYTLLESSSCCPEIEQSSSYEGNIVLSTEAYEEAITHFMTDEGSHTDDFGGVFVDENGLHNIYVVGNRKPVTSDYLIYKQAENSLNFLESIVDEMGSKSQQFSIWMVSVCEVCNGVIICLESESQIPLLLEHLKTNGLLKKGVLNIFVGENQVVPN